MRSKTTVVLADDNPAVLEQVSRFLQNHFEIVAAAANGAMAVEAVVALQPDVVILDIAMPVMSGIEAAREIKRRGYSSKIVFLSVQQDRDYVEAAVEMGASYVLKSRMKSNLRTGFRHPQVRSC